MYVVGQNNVDRYRRNLSVVSVRLYLSVSVARSKESIAFSSTRTTKMRRPKDDFVFHVD